MGVNFEQPVISGSTYTYRGDIKQTAPGQYSDVTKQGPPVAPASPTGVPTGAPQPGMDWQSYFNQQNAANAPAKALPTDLPIEADPAYAIFAANTGLQRDLSRIGVQQDIPEIQRQMNTQLSDADTQQRDATAGAETMAEQRGLGRSGMAVQKQADIAGQFAKARENIIGTGQAQIDKATATDQAVQRSQGAAGAGAALSTIGKTACV